MDLAERDERLVLIFGDVSVYLFKDFADKRPDRFYNLGILENTMISTAAGMSAMGLLPVCHTIAPFLTERSFEQIKLDLCYNRFPASIVTCGATFDYAWDGASHHAYYDLAMLRLLPGMEVFQPGSEREFDLLYRQRYAGPNARYFRLSDYPHMETFDVEFGRGVVLKDGEPEYTVVTAGPILGNVLEAVRDLPVNLIYFHTLKPIDRELLARFRNTRILVVHDAHGLLEAVHEEPGLRVEYHGLRDEFMGSYGKVHDLRRQLGLDPAGIRERVQQFVAAGRGVAGRTAQ